MRFILLAAVAGATLGLGACVAPFTPPPIPPVTVEQMPLPPVSAQELIWQPGSWQWNGATYVWEPGRFVPASAAGNRLWQPGYWAQTSGGWAWQPARWL